MLQIEIDGDSCMLFLPACDAMAENAAIEVSRMMPDKLVLLAKHAGGYVIAVHESDGEFIGFA